MFGVVDKTYFTDKDILIIVIGQNTIAISRRSISQEYESTKAPPSNVSEKIYDSRLKGVIIDMRN